MSGELVVSRSVFPRIAPLSAILDETQALDLGRLGCFGSTQNGSTVPSFSFSEGPVQGSFFHILRDPLADLCEDLLHDFAGMTLTFGQVFHSHHINQPYTEQNYRDAILRLEEQSLVDAFPAAAQRRNVADKKTLSEKVRITFPGAKGGSSGR